VSIRRRLGIVVTHPIQYQVPLYRHLAEATSIEPHVFYLTDHGVSASYDPGFAQRIHYDISLLDGYEHEFVANWSPWASPSTPWGACNPTLPRAIRHASLDALLVHGWHNVSTWLAYATAMAGRIPYLLRGEARPDPHDLPPVKGAFKHALLRPLVRHAAACLAIGSENRKFYTAYGAAPERIFHAPYSVDTNRFETAGNIGRMQRAERLAALGLNAAHPVVLFAAKLQPWKRPFDVVRALDLLAPSVILIVIGDGPLRSELEQAAAQRPWMRVLGFVNQTEIGEWYGVADLFVLPSDHEPWGLAVNEAMAAGALPIVSDAVGCAPDLVTPEIGWVYETGNLDELACAIRAGTQCINAPERRAAARRRSHDWGIAATAAGIEQAVRAVVNQ